MQLRLKGTTHQDGDLVIYVSEGGSSADIPVLRSKDSNYRCFSRQCIYKNVADFCEHVHFAREQHDLVIAPTEEVKAQEKLRLATAELERARARVAALERLVPSDEPAAISGPRRIVLEKET